MTRPSAGLGSERVLQDDYDALLLDLDGVVYAGGAAVPHAVSALVAARAAGLRLAFVTNNASRTPEAIAEQLCSLGVEALPSEVASSAQAAGRLLTDLPPGAPVLVAGGPGLWAAVEAAGMRPVRAASDAPVAVVQGYAPEVGWLALAEVTVAVRAGARWIATNLDATIPSERGILPGNGTLVAAVSAALGRGPDAVAGKPQRPLHDEAVQRTRSSRPLVVGDRLDTDIEGANAVGADSLLVLTGVCRPADLVVAAGPRRPTYLGLDLRALTEAARPASAGAPGWRATADTDLITLSGAGDPVDALRAVLALSWPIVDDGGAPRVEVPATLADWWVSGY